jgi:hypothetical protein
MKGIMFIDYMHIPKNEKLLRMCKKYLPVIRVRGRGRNYEALWRDAFTQTDEGPIVNMRVHPRVIGRDGHVAMKYCSYYYLSLGFRKYVPTFIYSYLFDRKNRKLIEKYKAEKVAWDNYIAVSNHMKGETNGS